MVDLTLTIKTLHFQKMHAAETGLRDYHKNDLDFSKACSSILRAKVIYYRSYMTFNESDF